MRFHANHGVLPQERTVGNDYVVNISLKMRRVPDFSHDDIAAVPNYADVYETVERTMRRPANLIERVAEQIGENLCAEFPAIADMDVDVRKLCPPISGVDCGGVGVRLHIVNSGGEE